MASQSDHNKIEIPLDLIPELNTKEKYLFQSVAKLDDNLSILYNKTDEQTQLLNKILTQTTATNGRVTVLENEIKILRKDNNNFKPEIEKVKKVSIIVKNKWFWIGIATTFLVIIPSISAAYPPKIIFDIITNKIISLFS